MERAADLIPTALVASKSKFAINKSRNYGLVGLGLIMDYKASRVQKYARITLTVIIVEGARSLGFGMSSTDLHLFGKKNRSV